MSNGDLNDLTHMPTINLKTEERFAWLCGMGVLAIIAGVAEWRAREWKSLALKPPAEPAALVARVAKLEARADAQAKLRCLNVTTDRMDLAINPVENLGKKKVGP